MSTNHRCHGRRGKRSHVISFIVAAGFVVAALAQWYVSLAKLLHGAHSCPTKKKTRRRDEEEGRKNDNNNNGCGGVGSAEQQ